MLKAIKTAIRLIPLNLLTFFTFHIFKVTIKKLAVGSWQTAIASPDGYRGSAVGSSQFVTFVHHSIFPFFQLLNFQIVAPIAISDFLRGIHFSKFYLNLKSSLKS
jgi:hypothetical protein